MVWFSDVTEKKTIVEGGFFQEDWVTPTKLQKDRIKRNETQLHRSKIVRSRNKNKTALKRINKVTGKPFRTGYKDSKNGKIFLCYNLYEIKKNGFYVERWVTEKQYRSYKKQKSLRQKEYLKTLKLKDRLKISISRSKSRAREKEMEFSVSTEYLLSLYPKTGKCPILGIDMELGGDRENSPTIDRIDNSKGYVTGNVTWISFRANYVKGNSTKSEILQLANWLKNIKDG